MGIDRQLLAQSLDSPSSLLSSDFRSPGSVCESHRKITISLCDIMAALFESLWPRSRDKRI